MALPESIGSFFHAMSDPSEEGGSCAVVVRG
jgi:hypothetical protein